MSNDVSGLGLSARFESDLNSQRRTGLITGIGMAAAGAAILGASRLPGQAELPSAVFPYSGEVADAINGVDTVLSAVGVVGLSSALVGVGALKVAGYYDQRAGAIDALTDRELTPELRRRSALLSMLAAGRWPIMGSAVVALTSLFGAIGNEIEVGPNRPIDAMVEIFPGADNSQVVVQYGSAMPMVDSHISPQLTENLVSEARVRGVAAMPYVINLGAISDGREESNTLTFGVPMGEGDPANWDVGSSCDSFPIIIDSSSGIELGQQGVVLNGSPTEVIGTVDGSSAINRIGVIADIEAVQVCLEKNPTTTGVAIDAPDGMTQEIIELANQTIGETVTSISSDDLRSNSQEFWRNNVKPLTNIFALIAGIVAYVSISRDISDRLFRNRRELKMKLEEGVPSAAIAAMETARTMKELPLATLLGTAAAWAASPLISMAVLGTQAVVGMKEAMAGAGVVFGSSVIALARKVGTRNRIHRSLGANNSTGRRR